MCFGAAFIASNSSSAFKVKQVFLTQNLKNDIHIKISPLNESDALTEEEQKAEGLEEDEIIKYNQEFRLFNTSDYAGKSKGLSLNYNKDMKIELFKKDGEELELLDTFLIDNLEKQYENEISFQKREIENDRKKKKKEAEKKEKEKKAKEAKDKNSTDSEEGDKKKEEEKEQEKKSEKKEDEKPAEEEEEIVVPKPKTKVSIEYSRSGYLQVTKATVGTMLLNKRQERKSIQMSEDQLRVGKARMKWYKQRDEDKIKTDIAKNDFESMIYKLKDFLNEDENHKYIDEAKRLIYIEQLSEMEDWLYDEGADMNYTVYNNKAKNLTNDYNHYQHLKTEHTYRSEILSKTETAMQAYEAKIEDLKINKTWITEQEFKDVEGKISDLREWVANMTEQ